METFGYAVVVCYGVLFVYVSASVAWGAWQRSKRRKRDAPMQPGEKLPEWFMGDLLHQLAEEGAALSEIEPEPVLVRVKAQRLGR